MEPLETLTKTYKHLIKRLISNSKISDQIIEDCIKRLNSFNEYERIIGAARLACLIKATGFKENLHSKPNFKRIGNRVILNANIFPISHFLETETFNPSQDLEKLNKKTIFNSVHLSQMPNGDVFSYSSKQLELMLEFVQIDRLPDPQSSVIYVYLEEGREGSEEDSWESEDDEEKKDRFFDLKNFESLGNLRIRKEMMRKRNRQFGGENEGNELASCIELKVDFKQEFFNTKAESRHNEINKVNQVLKLFVKENYFEELAQQKEEKKGKKKFRIKTFSIGGKTNSSHFKSKEGYGTPKQSLKSRDFAKNINQLQSPMTIGSQGRRRALKRINQRSLWSKNLSHISRTSADKSSLIHNSPKKKFRLTEKTMSSKNNQKDINSRRRKLLSHSLDISKLNSSRRKDISNLHGRKNLMKRASIYSISQMNSGRSRSKRSQRNSINSSNFSPKKISSFQSNKARKYSENLDCEMKKGGRRKSKHSSFFVKVGKKKRQSKIGRGLREDKGLTLPEILG